MATCGSTTDPPKRIAIAHDYFTQLGGAERVVKTWIETLRPVSLSTIVGDPETLSTLAVQHVRTTSLQRVPLLRRDPRYALPFLQFAAARMRLDAAPEAVLISTSGFAHHLRTKIPTVIYWHTPPRWLYAVDDYTADMPRLHRLAVRANRAVFQKPDRRSVGGRALHLCNSHVTAARLKQAYGILARVVPPPVAPIPGPAEKPSMEIPDRFLLVVGRSRGYKNTRIVAEAAERLGLPLVVVGQLPHRDRPWPKTHRSASGLSDPQLKWLYQNALVLVSASREDFGLTPLEANWEGTPALLLEAGGFLETLKPGVNGEFFQDETAQSLEEALAAFDPTKYARAAVRAVAESFSPQIHTEVIRDALRKAMDR